MQCRVGSQSAIQHFGIDVIRNGVVGVEQTYHTEYDSSSVRGEGGRGDHGVLHRGETGLARRRLCAAHICGMPIAFTTVAHLSTSTATYLLNSSAGPPTISKPILANFSRTSASPSTAVTSALIRVTSAGGVPPGAKKPTQM